MREYAKTRKRSRMPSSTDILMVGSQHVLYDLPYLCFFRLDLPEVEGAGMGTAILMVGGLLALRGITSSC